MRKVCYAAAGFLCMIVLGCGGSGTDSGGPPGGALGGWSKFAGTPGNTGASPTSDAQGTIKWKFRVSGLPGPAVIGEDGTVYFGQKELAGGLFAINGNTGSLKWSIPSFANFNGAPAVGNSGLLYVYLTNGLNALSTATGNIVWSVAVIGADTDGVGLGADGTVYIGTAEPSIMAFNGMTGALLWDCSTGSSGNVTGCPAVDANNVVYATQSDGSIVAIKNGVLQWKVQTGFPVRGSVTVGANNLIYAQSGFNHFGCFRATDGSPVWSAITNSDNEGQLIGSDGTVYSSGQTPPTVKAYSAATGQVLRSGTINGNVGLHAMTANTVYAEVNDTLIALNAASLTTKWSFKTGDYISGAAAIAPDGTVVFPSADRFVYALK